jgi:autotransporter-associated beta strand protein
MKSIFINTSAKRPCLLFAALLVATTLALPAAAPTGKLYWDPLATGGTGAGGTGTWDITTANWWTGAAPYTWISGTTGSVTTYTDLYFGASGQGGAPYEVTLALDDLMAPSISNATADLYAFKLNFSGDYIIRSTSAQRVLIGGATGGSYVYFDVMTDAGKTVTFDGGAQGVTLQSYGNSSINPSVRFGGGGNVILQNNAAIIQGQVNGRITIGQIADSSPTTLTLADDTVTVNGSRIYVDNGTLNINGANVEINNTLASNERSTLHIGNAKASQPVALNLNSGTLKATMTYNASYATNYGMLFGNRTATTGDSGGTFNLNGGVFETTDIGVMDTTGSTAAHFVFNGGTLRVSGAAVSNQLSRFIAGFGGAGQSVVAEAGGAFIDTSAAVANTLISAAISGSGNLVKLGANTLQFTATQAYTGTTIVSGGILQLQTSTNAIASSSAVVVEAGAVLNAAGGTTPQTLRNLSGSGTLTNGTSTFIAFNDTGESSTFAGALVLGSGGLTKSGSGTLILTADNAALTRGTLVSAGKLLLGDATNAKLGGLVTVENGAVFGGLGVVTGTGVASGTVALHSGGILQSGTAAAGVLTVDTLQLNAGSILGFNIDAGNASSSLSVTNPITFLSGSAADIIINLNSLISGTYTLGNIGADLTGTGTAAVTYAGALIGGRQSAILTNNAGSLQLALDAGSSLKVIWTGATDAIWNTTGTNWKKDGAADEVPFAPGDAVVFDDSLATGRRDITLASAITVSDLTVSGTGNYSFTGFSITADKDQAPGLAGVAGRLVMESTGTLTLAPDAVNNFKGGIDLKAGTLRAATAGALGASTINVVNDAALLVDTATLTASGTVDFGTSGKTLAFETGATAAAVLSGKVTGSGTLAKTGAGALLLAGANDHTVTALSGGTLAFGHNAALGSTFAVGASGATLRADLANFSVASAMNVGANTVTFDTGTNNGAWTGGITGSGTLGKAGAGTLDIATPALANTVGLDIGQGKIRLAQPTAGNYTLANKITGPGILTVRLTGAADALALGTGALSGFAGTLAVENASFALDATSAAEFSTASLGVGAGSRIDKASGDMSIAGLSLDGGTIQFAVNGISPDGILTVGTLNTGSAGAETVVMMDLGSGGSSTQLNPAVPPATNILDHDNGSATGEKVIAVTGSITGAGTLKLTGTDGNPVAGSITSVIEQYVPGSGTLKENVADATYSAALVTGSDGVYLGSALTSISVYDGKQLILDNSAPGVDNAFTIGISGSGGLRVRASGTIVLSGSNTYTGITMLASGVTRAARADIFKDSAGVWISNGATFETGGNAQTLHHLGGAGIIDLGGATLTLVAEEHYISEFSGALTGAGHIIKTGSGALTLSGVSARGTGTTGIDGGRLIIKNNLSALGSGVTSFSSSTAVLEFNTITSGTHNLAITGGGIVEVRDSNFAFGNSGNRLSVFRLINSTVLPTASVHALGSTTARVRIDSTSALYVSYGHSTTTNALRVGGVTVAPGGKLLYGLNGAVNKFDLTGGVLTLEDGAVIGFAGRVADGIYDLVEEGTGTIDRQGALVLDRGPNKMVQWRPTDNGDIELITLSFDPTVQVSMTFDAMMAAMSAVYSRMSESFLLPVIEANRASKINGLWMRGFASSAEYDETPDQYGHTERTHGVVVGFDALSKNRSYLMGVYGGFAGGALETDANAKGEADRQFAGLYGAAKWGRFYIGIDGMAGWSKSDNTRHQADGGVSEGTSKANYYGGSVEAGLVFQPTQTFTLKPAVGLHYLNAEFGAYKERGDSAIAYPDVDQDLLQSLVSVQASWKFTTPWGWPSMADLTYAWRQGISEKSDDVVVRFVSDTTQAPYAIRAGDYARGGHSIGGGIRSIVNDSLSLGLAYDFEIASHRSRHTVNGTVRWSW